MNVRLTAVLIVVLALVGGAVLITRALDSKTVENEPTQLYRVTEDDITGVTVSHDGESVEYQLLTDQASIAAALGDDPTIGGRPLDSLWVIKDGNDTPVFLEKWSGTPLLLSGPRSDRGALQSLEDPATFGLDPPQTSVTIKLLETIQLTFELGDATPDEENWYARLANGTQLFTVAGAWAEVITRLATEPPYPPTMFNVKSDELNSIVAVRGLNRYDYLLQDGQWVIVEYAALDLDWVVTGEENIPVFASAWADAPSLFGNRNISTAQQINITNAADYGLDFPQVEVEIKTMDEETASFFLGDPTPDGKSWYAGATDQEVLYLVPAEWGEAVVRLINEPPFPPEPADSTS